MFCAGSVFPPLFPRFHPDKNLSGEWGGGKKMSFFSFLSRTSSLRRSEIVDLTPGNETRGGTTKKKDKKLRFPRLFVIFGRFPGNSGGHGMRNPWEIKKQPQNGALRDFFKETARIWWQSDSEQGKKREKRK